MSTPFDAPMGQSADSDLVTDETAPSASPPRAPKRPEVARHRTFHGETFLDPWEWLRDKEDPEVIAHLNAENAWADTVTAPTAKLAEHFVREFHEHTVETDTSVPVRIGDFWYYQRTTEGLSYPAHYRLAISEDGAGNGDQHDDPLPPTITPGVPLEGEVLLVDENEHAKGRDFFALAALTPSPDGRFIAWQRDIAGDERWTIIVQDVATGEVVDDVVDGAGWGLAWSKDSSTLLYALVDDAWRQHEIWTHAVGTNRSGDRLVMAEPDEQFMIWFDSARDPHWVAIHSTSTTTGEAWLWNAYSPEAPVIPVTGRTPDVLVQVEPAGDHLLIVHTATSREGTLAAAPFPDDQSAWLPADYGSERQGDAPSSAPETSAMPLLAPPSSWVSLREAAPGERIAAVEAHADYVALIMRSGGLTQVEYRTRAVPLTCTKPHPSTEDLAGLWGQGTFVEADSPVRALELSSSERFEDRTLRVTVESLVGAPSVWQIDPHTGERTLLKTLEVPGWDPAEYVEERVWVLARDGTTQIPVSLVHHRDVVAEGSAPGWVMGYGSYEVSYDPNFAVLRLPLLKRGVVFAIAHIRGGGEMGRAWYEDGKFEVKEHTFSDFVDVSRWLVDSGWVARDRLIAEGGSAGGLLMGAVANAAPELYRVIVANVPFVDALTTILDPSLPLTAGEWEEWGNPIESEEIYRAMRAYTPYENVRDGAKYPAIFASTSLNDTRVFFVEPTKWVQRLREATASDQRERPVVLRTEMVAGHGGKSGRYGKWDQRAEELAFALGQVGVRE